MDTDELAAKIVDGDVRSASITIRNIEDGAVNIRQVMKHIFPHTGRAHIVGITGSPGAGKSTVTSELITCNRKSDDSNIGVLAIDPTSPFTGGAILGDRIRMQCHAEDPKVFVRSLATRGTMGGLARAVGDAVHIMDAMGKDLIFIETVGAGQQEVEIINHAHTVIVVLVPGMGDEIQVMKAGILEIGDIFIINKADRDGSGRLYKAMNNMLDMAHPSDGGWRPPVLLTHNLSDFQKFIKDIKQVSTVIDAHYRYLMNNNAFQDRMRRKVVFELNEALRMTILEPALNQLIVSGEFNKMVDKVLNKESDPYSLIESGVVYKFIPAVMST